MSVSQDVARRVITHLKGGTTPIDCVELVNVGNERWYEAAAAQLEEVESDGDSVVRFVNGYYGDGKTHFLGMLRSLALNRGWLVTYVTAETTPLNKFERVYAELVKGLTLPPALIIPEWLPKPERGAYALLCAVFSRMYFEANRLGDKSGLQKERVLEALRTKAVEFAADSELNQAVGSAVVGFVEATIRGDRLGATTIASWMAGEPVIVREAGLTRRIDQRMSRDVTRGISILAKRAGAGGVLVLLDEAERIMEQSRGTRTKSYGVIRDLLDNADNQGGMRSSVTYVAGTPDLFKQEKGFPEYDALRSRLASSAIAIPGLIDWRGVVVDLTKTPLPHDGLLQLATRVLDLHATARGWDARAHLSADMLASIVARVERGAFAVSKARLLASYLATLLEIVEQNRDAAIDTILDTTLRHVQGKLAQPSASAQWD